jgi:hypothetical protein
MFALSLNGLGSKGTHRLKGIVTYRQTVGRRTETVTKAVAATLSVG